MNIKTIDTKIKILKLWYIICFVFGFDSLNILVEESHEVVYEMSDETKPVQYLACVKLKDLIKRSNKTETDLKRLGGDLFDRINNTRDNNGFRTKNPKRFEDFLNRTKPGGGYLVFNEMICLIANETEFQEINWILSGQKIMLFAIRIDTSDFVQMKAQGDQIDQLVVLKREHPVIDFTV